MIEIPESRAIGLQANNVLVGRTITTVSNATHPHKFTWYSGDPSTYPGLLRGRTFCSATGYGAFVDLELDGGVHLVIGDGVNLRYFESEAEIPKKYQLLITLDNNAFLVFTVAMYGGIHAYVGELDSAYFRGAVTKVSPLEAGFDAAYFAELLAGSSQKLSSKAFLATEQRIPGLGNGTLQDILFLSRIHPKCKLSMLSAEELENLYGVVKTTLQKMASQGGRDTERDLFGYAGGYRTILSRNTCADPCPVCGGAIEKEAYLGGAVYYCPRCQTLK